MGQLKRWAGLSVSCTKCGALKKVPPCHMKRGSYTANYRCKTCASFIDKSLPNTYEAGYIIGAVTGDGYLWHARKHKIGVRLDICDGAFADKFERCAIAATGKKPWRCYSLRKSPGTPSIKMPAREMWQHRLGICSRDWFYKAEPFKTGDYSLVGGMGNEFRTGFVQGLIDAEGYENPNYIDVANKNMDLLNIIATLVYDLGLGSVRVYGPYSYARGVAHLRITKTSLHKTQEVPVPCPTTNVIFCN